MTTAQVDIVLDRQEQIEQLVRWSDTVQMFALAMSKDDYIPEMCLRRTAELAWGYALDLYGRE